MAKRYRIPEIRALPLLSSADIREDGSLDLRFDVEEIAGEANLTWTMQDDCPMFHQARQILKGGPERKEQDVLSDVFVYIDFSGIFDRRAVGRVAELQKRAEWMFRPEGIPMNLQTRFYNYVAFERSASMSRGSKLCFVRKDIFEELSERMMLGMTIGTCQLSKLYAYNGLLFTGGRRIDDEGILNSNRIIVIDNPKSITFNQKIITVTDDGTDGPVRTYKRVEKTADIEVLEFDGEGLVSPKLARRMDPLEGHPHHSFQIRMPYIKGVVHEVDYQGLFRELGIDHIVDIWGQSHDVDEVNMILTKSMFKGFGWMSENGLSWTEYLARYRKYDHALYISGMDMIAPQDVTELNYQFLNTAAITDEEFRPKDLPAGWNHTPDWDNRLWLTKETEKAYWDYLGNNHFQRQYFLNVLENPTLEITDRRKQRARLIEKNVLYINEPVFQKELQDKAESILSKYENANLLVAGDNRYLSDDLMRMLACLAQPVSKTAWRRLLDECMGGFQLYAPKPAYKPNATYVLLRNPHIARNEEAVVQAMEPGPLREKYLSHLHYVAMVDSRFLIPERLGGADFDGDMVKTIADPLMNRCVARNGGELPLLKIPSAEPVLADSKDWKARFETVKSTFSSRVGQISNAALRRSILAYDENSTSEERERCRRETETLAILTGLEIDSAKSGVKPDLSAYLGSYKAQKSLFLRFKSIQKKSESRRWYEPTRKKRLEKFFDSVDWDSVSSNLEKLPYYAHRLAQETEKFKGIPAPDEQLFTFAQERGWKENLDPELLKTMCALIKDYEEAQRRRRYIRIELEYMSRKTDVQRILFSRNQEEEFTVDELYHSFDYLPPQKIRTMRRMLTEEGWMFTSPKERLDVLNRFDLPAESVRYWELFCDFRSGGYRVLGDILCDFDDMHAQKGIREHLLAQKDDSDALRFLLRDLERYSDYKEELAHRCMQWMSPHLGRAAIDFKEAAKCAIALGKRQFALEVLPAALYELTIDRSAIYAEEKPKKRRWFHHAE